MYTSFSCADEGKCSQHPISRYTQLVTASSPTSLATLKAIYWDHKKPEHYVDFNLSRQEGQKREVNRKKKEVKFGVGNKNGDYRCWGEIASQLSS